MFEFEFEAHEPEPQSHWNRALNLLGVCAALVVLTLATIALIGFSNPWVVEALQS
ncbi:hypothetical protein [Actinoplanes regularis]|uniref:Uncharacterized protein n=1 Tax=Actinoplanes regularis TaxID=52697 RepID=A0A239BXI1_9ACTN|nr:hypothetical protein [Actinoplanes regularis]GIE88265.1 hypothetical protein Are01nite_47450 [Actinoplanes regularis]SNS11784.1 hypothetical protein SAMN06264365_110151 [Actinoplanes regularis]